MAFVCPAFKHFDHWITLGMSRSGCWDLHFIVTQSGRSLPSVVIIATIVVTFLREIIMTALLILKRGFFLPQLLFKVFLDDSCWNSLKHPPSFFHAARDFSFFIQRLYPAAASSRFLRRRLERCLTLLSCLWRPLRLNESFSGWQLSFCPLISPEERLSLLSFVHRILLHSQQYRSQYITNGVATFALWVSSYLVASLNRLDQHADWSSTLLKYLPYFGV